jgi:hypothetical protein
MSNNTFAPPSQAFSMTSNDHLTGMSLLAYIATHALQGILSHGHTNSQDATREALSHADELLKGLMAHPAGENHEKQVPRLQGEGHG